MVMELWLDTCAKNFTNPEAIKDFARSVHFTENPEYSPSLLNGSPGTVWDASLGNLLQVGLVVLDDGTCRVVARKADAETVNETFTKELQGTRRSEEHTSELQSLMRISYAVFCLKNKKR